MEKGNEYAFNTLLEKTKDLEAVNKKGIAPTQLGKFYGKILTEHNNPKDRSESKLQIMSICPVEIRNNFKVIIKIRGFSKVEKSTLTLEIESIPNSPGSLKL